jgi:hypothetical protein
VAGVGREGGEAGGARDEGAEAAAGAPRELELDVGFKKGDDAACGLVDVVLAIPESSAISLTIICSPGARPRLDMGSSGTIVRVRGG